MFYPFTWRFHDNSIPLTGFHHFPKLCRARTSSHNLSIRLFFLNLYQLLDFLSTHTSVCHDISSTLKGKRRLRPVGVFAACYRTKIACYSIVHTKHVCACNFRVLPRLERRFFSTSSKQGRHLTSTVSLTHNAS